MPTNPIFCAIDRPDLEGALELIGGLRGSMGGVKLGLEFFTSQGPAGVRAVAECGLPIFLDLKLHDIPNTVAGALRSLEGLGVGYVTLHAAGGAAMLRAAAAVPQRPKLLAVTLLTSLDAADLAALGVPGSPQDHVLRLGRLARTCGIDGVVCSPLEIAALRADLGPDAVIASPGIRAQDAAPDDQKRTLSPAEALRAGADILVVGRPITAAADPAAAARALVATLPQAA